MEEFINMEILIEEFFNAATEFVENFREEENIKNERKNES